MSHYYYKGIQLYMAANHASVSCYADVIDSRDVIARVNEIADDHRDEDTGEIITDPAAWEPADRAQYDMLTALLSDCRGAEQYDGHTDDGMILIRETHWVEYVKDFAVEMYESSKFKQYNPRTFRDEELSWSEISEVGPFGYIDWDAYAAHIRRDCPEIEYGPNNATYIIFH